MAKKIYSLYNSGSFEGDQQLAVEISEKNLAVVLGAPGKIAGFEYYDADDNSLEEVLDFVKQNSQLLNKNYSETKVFYNLPESVLIPVGQFNTSVASEFIDVAFGIKPFCQVNVENVNVVPGIVNVYRSNENWQQVISHYFRAVTKRHLFSRLIETVADNGLHVQFYKEEIIVIAKKDKQLQMARSFAINSSEDILFYLLNTCKQTAIDPLKTCVAISGFIEEDSAAFKMMHQYFEKVKPDNFAAAVFPPETSTYPPHYFTAFFKLLL